MICCLHYHLNNFKGGFQMRNKTRLLLFALILIPITCIAVLHIYNLLTVVSFALFLVLYLGLAVNLYIPISKHIKHASYEKSIKFLSQNYTEITALHPTILKLKCSIPITTNIKVYARYYYGYIIDIKVVSKLKTYKITTGNWNWFYTNFKEKESN